MMSRGVFSDRIGTGLGIGFWRFEGTRREVNSSTMIPLTAAAECRFQPGQHAAVMPELSAGYSYNRTEYTGKKYSPSGFHEGTITESSFEPIASAGLRFEIVFAGHFSAGLGVRYGAVIESAGLQRFASAECSFGITF